MGHSKEAIKRRSRKRKLAKRLKFKAHRDKTPIKEPLNKPCDTHEDTSDLNDNFSDVSEFSGISGVEPLCQSAPKSIISTPYPTPSTIAVEKETVSRPKDSACQRKHHRRLHYKNDVYYSDDPLAKRFAQWRTLKYKLQLLESRPI